jgi:hypothetical protein
MDLALTYEKRHLHAAKPAHRSWRARFGIAELRIVAQDTGQYSMAVQICACRLCIICLYTDRDSAIAQREYDLSFISKILLVVPAAERCGGRFVRPDTEGGHSKPPLTKNSQHAAPGCSGSCAGCNEDLSIAFSGSWDRGQKIVRRPGGEIQPAFQQ